MQPTVRLTVNGGAHGQVQVIAAAQGIENVLQSDVGQIASGDDFGRSAIRVFPQGDQPAIPHALKGVIHGTLGHAQLLRQSAHAQGRMPCEECHGHATHHPYGHGLQVGRILVAGAHHLPEGGLALMGTGHLCAQQDGSPRQVQPEHEDRQGREGGVDGVVIRYTHLKTQVQDLGQLPERAPNQATQDRGTSSHPSVGHEHVDEGEPYPHGDKGSEARVIGQEQIQAQRARGVVEYGLTLKRRGHRSGRGQEDRHNDDD